MLENTEILRKALVLGAGHAQADLMRFLKKNRWWVISSGLHQESKCRNIADEFRRLDVRDIGAVERLARANSVDLIYSVGLDAAVPTIATVAPPMSIRAARYCAIIFRSVSATSAKSPSPHETSRSISTAR